MMTTFLKTPPIVGVEDFLGTKNDFAIETFLEAPIFAQKIELSEFQDLLAYLMQADNIFHCAAYTSSRRKEAEKMHLEADLSFLKDKIFQHLDSFCTFSREDFLHQTGLSIMFPKVCTEWQLVSSVPTSPKTPNDLTSDSQEYVLYASLYGQIVHLCRHIRASLFSPLRTHIAHMMATLFHSIAYIAHGFDEQRAMIEEHFEEYKNFFKLPYHTPLPDHVIEWAVGATQQVEERVLKFDSKAFANCRKQVRILVGNTL